MRPLTTPVPLRYAQAMTRIEKDDAIKAAVLISAKTGSWIAGANIKMLENLESGAAAEEVAGIGQKGMDRIAAMQKTKPWVAAIDGERFAKTLKALGLAGSRQAISRHASSEHEPARAPQRHPSEMASRDTRVDASSRAQARAWAAASRWR